MLSIKARKILFPLLLIGSFAGLFLVAIHIADFYFFTGPFHKEWKHPVLLVWPDHVEMRWFRELSEVSPRPKDAAYTFNVAPEREAWVIHEVIHTPSPNKNAGWNIEVKQLGPSRQRIQLELIGDGISGIVYEAGNDEIVPLASRATGPGGAMIILFMTGCLWAGLWLVVWVGRKLWRGARDRGKNGTQHAASLR